jgi:hypothetical protein
MGEGMAKKSHPHPKHNSIQGQTVWNLFSFFQKTMNSTQGQTVWSLYSFLPNTSQLQTNNHTNLQNRVNC